VLFTKVTFLECTFTCNGVTFFPVTCTFDKVLKLVTFASTGSDTQVDTQNALSKMMQLHGNLKLVYCTNLHDTFLIHIHIYS